MYARKFGTRQWSFIGPGSEKSGTVPVRTVNKVYGTKLQKGCCWNSQKADVQFSALQANCPEVNSEAKDIVNCRFTLLPLKKQLRLLFRTIVSANHLSLYGAVAEMCEEYESLYERTERPDMVMGQSIVLSAIKTAISLESDDPANQNFLLQQYEERIEKLSQQDKLSKFCMDAGFLSVV